MKPLEQTPLPLVLEVTIANVPGDAELEVRIIDTERDRSTRRRISYGTHPLDLGASIGRGVSAMLQAHAKRERTGPVKLPEWAEL